MNATSQTRVFLSYSRRDAEFVDRLHEDLIESGLDIWIDRIELRAGDSLPGRIFQAIAGAQFVVAVLSRESAKSKWVQKELEVATQVELDGGRLKVIPVLKEECDVPACVLGKLHCDFSSGDDYQRSLQYLLRALDDADTTSSAASDDPYSVNLTADRLVEAVFADDDRMVKAIRELPLAKVLNQATVLRSMSGAARSDILGQLAMASNSGSRGDLTHIVFIGFLRDQVSARPRSADFPELTTAIVQERAIHESYRHFALKHIADNFTWTESRRAKVALLPDLFRADRLDPLADELIAEFFDAKNGEVSRLETLWQLDAPAYRAEIASYILSTGDWASEPRIDLERISITRDVSVLREQLRKDWRGLLAAKPAHPRVQSAAEKMNAFVEGRSTSIAGLALACEMYARGTASDESIFALTGVVGNDAITRSIERHGKGATFRLLCDFIASPYIDVLSSVLALFALGISFGLDSLRYDDQFPGGLLRAKPDRYDSKRPRSVLDGLIEAAESDEPCKIAVMSLLTFFPRTYFLSAAAIACKQRNASLPAIREIKRHIKKLDIGA